MCPTALHPTPDPPLALDALTVTVKAQPDGPALLQDVSVVVAAGEAVALVGEAGSGGAILLQAVLGMLPPGQGLRRTGSIHVAGRPVGSAASHRRALRRHVGVVWRDDRSALDPLLPVGRQIAARARSRRALPGVLAAAGLDAAGRGLLRAYPHQLSHAHRLRVALAMALAPAPALLVLDEPTLGLDTLARAAFLRSLVAIRDRGDIAILLLTADFDIAAALAGRSVVLLGGRMVESGRTADLLARPAHPYTEALLASRCGLDADRARQRQPPLLDETGADGAAAMPSGCAFRGPCPAGSTRCAQPPALRPTGWHDGTVACWNVNSAARRAAPPRRWPAPARSSAAPALRLDEVAYAPRRGVDVLAGVTLRVGDRETVAIVGPAGAGKTTLLRIAAGLLRPTGGQRLHGAGEPPQMIFADARQSLPPWQDVGEIVGRRLRRRDLTPAERATRIEEALALAQLPPEFAAARPDELTQAQAQRVAIARALVVPPALLLCDEPLALLQGAAAASLLNLLAGLRRSQKLAMLVATDDIAAARYLADRIVVLDRGRIVDQGAAEALVAAAEAAGGAVTRALIAAVAGPAAASTAGAA